MRSASGCEISAWMTMTTSYAPLAMRCATASTLRGPWMSGQSSVAELRGAERDVELHYRMPDPWKRRLFLALCRRYGLKPYRESGRHYSTVQVRAPKTFHERTLWPEYKALAAELDAHLEELTTRVIREAIDEDVTEAVEGAPKELPPASD
jgi:hypothetical protein